MFQKILIPLDGSKLAERALPHAYHIARIFGAQIQLLHVLDSTPYVDTPTITEPLNWQIQKAQADLYLSGIAAQARAQNLSAEHFLREGKTAESIIDFAQQAGSDLVVIATHGASGLSRWNLNSVANKVTSKICLSVLIVRTYLQPGTEEEGMIAGQLRGETPAVSALEAATPLSDMTSNILASAADTASAFPTAETTGEPEETPFYKKILVPIDTSRRAECVIPAATALAQQGAQTILTAVLQPPTIPAPPPYPEDFQRFSNRFVEESRAAVKLYLEEQRRRFTDVDTRIVENSNISAAIHELAEQEDVDLVVLCAHGQSGGTMWPYGSIVKNYIDYGVKHLLVIQDIPCSQFRATAAEIAAEKYGRR